jgi:hypothetical protein
MMFSAATMAVDKDSNLRFGSFLFLNGSIISEKQFELEN